MSSRQPQEDFIDERWKIEGREAAVEYVAHAYHSADAGIWRRGNDQEENLWSKID